MNIHFRKVKHDIDFHFLATKALLHFLPSFKREYAGNIEEL